MSEGEFSFQTNRDRTNRVPRLPIWSNRICVNPSFYWRALADLDYTANVSGRSSHDFDVARNAVGVLVFDGDWRNLVVGKNPKVRIRGAQVVGESEGKLVCSFG